MPERRVVIDHLTVGVTDVRRARDFYRHALAPLGMVELGPWSDESREMAFGHPGFDDFAISDQYEPGGQLHIAFAADRRTRCAGSTPPRSRRAGATTAPPARGPSTARATSAPSCSTRTATTSRPSSTRTSRTARPRATASACGAAVGRSEGLRGAT